MKNVIIIPCYNVEKFCKPVITLAIELADFVIAVDDGSTDGTPRILSELRDEAGAKMRVVTLPSNVGKGKALLEGFREALAEVDFEVLVTMDSDGQHDPRCIKDLVDAVSAGSDYVIGARNPRLMPFRSRLGNIAASALFRLIYKRSCRDTQSGFRAMRKQVARIILENIRASRYEMEMLSLILMLKSKLKVDSVEIPTIYIDKNKGSHFRPISDSVLVLRSLLAPHR